MSCGRCGYYAGNWSWGCFVVGLIFGAGLVVAALVVFGPVVL